MNAEIKRNDVSRIADSLGCHYDYVKKILRGDRGTSTRLAKKVLQAREILEASRKADDKKLENLKLELEGE